MKSKGLPVPVGKLIALCLAFSAFSVFAASAGPDLPGKKADRGRGHSGPPALYTLDSSASGVTQSVNNILNMTVVSRDSSDLKAEYRAGVRPGQAAGRDDPVRPRQYLGCGLSDRSLAHIPQAAQPDSRA